MSFLMIAHLIRDAAVYVCTRRRGPVVERVTAGEGRRVGKVKGVRWASLSVGGVPTCMLAGWLASASFCMLAGGEQKNRMR